MTTITLPLWGWVLVAAAAIVLMACYEHERMRKQLGTPWRWLCAYVAQRRLQKIQAQQAAPDAFWTPTDYSAKRARALAQLGDDYLLARPISRLPSIKRTVVQ